MKNWKIGARLMLLAGVLSLALLVVGLLGLRGMSNSIEGMRAVYEDSTLPLFDLEEINKINKINVVEMLRGMQHSPDNPYAKLHNHPVTAHTDRIESNFAKMDKLWARYTATISSPEEKALADKYIQSRQEFGQIIYMPALQALKSQDFASPAFATFTTSGLKYGQAMEKDLEHLITFQTQDAKQAFAK
ncbi:MAG: MCP four helix bundle domain-containing protein, partial [Burkholderiales bacterium]